MSYTGDREDAPTTSKVLAPEAAQIIALALAIKYEQDYPTIPTWQEAMKLTSLLREQGHVGTATSEDKNKEGK